MTTSTVLITEARPVVLRNICRAQGADGKSAYGTHKSAERLYLYMLRQSGNDIAGAASEDYLQKQDLQASGRSHPCNCPGYARQGPEIWQDADRAAWRGPEREVSALSGVAELPADMSCEEWKYLIEDWAMRELSQRGMICDWAVHAKPNEDGTWSSDLKPHVHLLITLRAWRRNGNLGWRNPRWLGTEEARRQLTDSWMVATGLRPVSPILARAA